MDTARFSPGPVGDHYLIVSELMPHKQIDVAIAAFNRLRLPLIVVGDGPDARAAAALAGPDGHASPAALSRRRGRRACRAPGR